MQQSPKKVQEAVKGGEIHFCCSDCAAELRCNPPYDGTYTQHQGICPICQEEKAITSARKLFGYHTFM